MTSSLADKIEAYLKQLISSGGKGYIELRRQYLAERFACVPSQINYVLTTRFTDSHGYFVETRRGGGGYIKVIKLSAANERPGDLFEKIGPQLCQQTAEAFITMLWEEGLISQRESKLMRAVANRENLDIDLPKRDVLRAKLLKAILRELLRNDI
ncbi:MAG: CtsR family transcriptional regulator [Clostridia bacterium]|nr:CtsR family transcriptional regulator [Clostridia bacterium]